MEEAHRFMYFLSSIIYVTRKYLICSSIDPFAHYTQPFLFNNPTSPFPIVTWVAFYEASERLQTTEKEKKKFVSLENTRKFDKKFCEWKTRYDKHIYELNEWICVSSFALFDFQHLDGKDKIRFSFFIPNKFAQMFTFGVDESVLIRTLRRYKWCTKQLLFRYRIV